MSILKTGTGSTLVRAGVTAAVALAALGGVATEAQAVAATQQAVTLSAVNGAAGGGNSITLTLASTASPKFTTGQVGVQFQSTTSTAAATATCSTNPALVGTSGNTQLTVPTGNLRFLSTTKLSVVVPNLGATTAGGSSAYWLLCVYNAASNGATTGAVTGFATTTPTVVAKANYMTATAPTIDGTVPIVPSSGPSTGGQTVTITGANFPTTISATAPLTATLGGLPMTNITPVSSTSFTATTPAKAASATTQALSVTTAGGTVTSAGVYTYVNGITVSPATVPSGVSVDVDVQGTGFNLLAFDATATAGLSSGNGTAAGTNDAGAHVYLVQGAYNGATYGAGANKTNGQLAECINPAVISDSELICTVDARQKITSASAGTYVYTAGIDNTTWLPNGAYTVTIVNSGNAASPTYQTVLSSGATFTVSNF